MTLEVLVVDGTGDDTVVLATGPIDLATAPVLADAIAALPEGAGHVIVDLSGVSFIDSSGLRVLAQQHRRLLEADGRSKLRLVVQGDPVERILEVTGLHGFFHVYATRDEARLGT